MNHTIKRIADHPWLLLLALLLFALLVRAAGFYRSVIDWDESTYLLMAQALLDGKTLYVEMIDTKPPMIYWVFAAVMKIFGESVVAIRVFGALLVGLSGWFVSRIARILWPAQAMLSATAGVFFILAISGLSLSFAIGRGQGLEINTEHLFITFGLGAIYFAVREKLGLFDLLFSGCLLACGFLTKQFSVFDAVGLSFLLLALYLKTDRTFWMWARNIGIVAISALGSLLLILWIFSLDTLAFQGFVDVTVAVFTKYSKESSVSDIATMFGDFFFISGSFTVLFLIALWHLSKDGIDAISLGLLGWFLLVVVGITFLGKAFLHYTYQLWPPMILIIVGALVRLQERSLWWKEAGLRYVLWFVGVLATASFIARLIFFVPKPDAGREIVNYLNQLPSDYSLYAYNRYHIVNFLVDKPVLTKYYHPSMVFQADQQVVFEIDFKEEMQQVFDQNPTYILNGTKWNSSYVSGYLKEHYNLNAEFSHSMQLWQKKE